MQYLSAQRWEKAQPVLERAEKAASRSSDPALRARARCPLALAYVVAGDMKSGEELISRTMADLPEDSPHALARAECLTRWSEFGFFTDEGEPMVRRASEALAAVAGAPVPSLLTRLDAQSALAYGYYLTRQNAKADAAFAELTKLIEQNGRDRTLAAADAWNNWGLVHHRGDIRKAEPLYRRSLELHRAIEGDAVGAVVLHNYAGVLQQLARHAEAEPVFQEAIRIARARQNTYVEIAATLELAGMYAETGRLAEARAASPRSTPTSEPKRSLPCAAPISLTRAASWRRRSGRPARRGGSTPSPSASMTASMPSSAPAPSRSSASLERSSRPATRTPLKRRPRRALALAESFVDKGDLSYLAGLSLAELGQIELARRQTETGRTTLRTALHHLQETLGPEHPATLDARRVSESAGTTPE